MTKEGIIFYADQSPGDRLPLHAFLVGALAGYILADQTLSDERLAERASQGGQANSSNEASTHGLLRTAIANAGVAVLILAAIVPPSSLLHAVSRLQNFEAAGVKLSFGGNTASNLAEAIRTASPPRSQWTGNTPSAQGGFVPIRLETMVELTHPPQVVWGNPQDDVFKNSAGFISAELGPTPATFPDQNRYGFTRRVQRDRALLWEIEKADSNREPSEAVRSRLLALGRAQEGFLALLAPHVSCLAEFVEATKDRRFVDYRTVNLVQDLFVIAHTWSKYEKRVTLESMGARGTGAVAATASTGGRTAAAATMSAGADPPRAAASSQARDTPMSATLTGTGAAGAAVPTHGTASGAASIEGGGPSTQLGELLRKLSGRLAGFSRWSQDVMGVWAGAASTSQQERAASATCEKSHNALSNVATAFGELSRDERLLSTSGFTPYVTIFVAQILSALDDHGAAVELLVDWLDDLSEIEAAAEEAGTRGYERQIAWHRLQSLIEVLILQKLSEHSPGGLPATLAALRATLDVVFPGAVEKLVNLDSLHAWRAGSSECRSANQSWKQGIVLSYLSWVKEYLDLLQRDLAEDASRLRPHDIKRVELLADANFDCFDWILVEEKQRRKNPLALASERAASRVEFMTTAAAVRMLEYEASRQWGATADDRNKTLLRSEMELRAAIARLKAIEEQSASLTPPAQTQKLTRLLFREPRQELLANARAVLNRMEALRKHH